MSRINRNSKLNPPKSGGQNNINPAASARSQYSKLQERLSTKIAYLLFLEAFVS